MYKIGIVKNYVSSSKKCLRLSFLWKRETIKREKKSFGGILNWHIFAFKIHSKKSHPNILVIRKVSQKL